VHDILTHRGGEQHRFLTDKSNLLTQRVNVYGFYLIAVNRDRAILWIVETLEQFNDGTFSTSGRSLISKNKNKPLEQQSLLPELQVKSFSESAHPCV
jgi:hypothetical protein